MTLGDLKSLAIVTVLIGGLFVVVPGAIIAALRMVRGCAGMLPTMNSLRSVLTASVLGLLAGMIIVVVLLWKADRLVSTVLFFALALAIAALMGSLMVLGVAKLLERVLRPKDAMCGDLLVVMCPLAAAFLVVLTDAEKNYRNVSLF